MNKTEETTYEEDDEFFDSESEPISTLSNFSEKITHKTQIKTIQEKASVESIVFYAVQFSNFESAKKVDGSRIFRNKDNAMRLCKQDPENCTFKVINGTIKKKNLKIKILFSFLLRYSLVLKKHTNLAIMENLKQIIALNISLHL